MRSLFCGKNSHFSYYGNKKYFWKCSWVKFTKMHGIGNDYVYVNCFEEHVTDPVKLARFVSDRHKGIGSDGLILIGPSRKADFKMQIFNADGSVAEMCGNGIRCVGKYVYEHGMTLKKELKIETLAGIRTIQLCIKELGGTEERVEWVSVDMGIPILEADKIPVISANSQVIGEKIIVNHLDYRMTAVSMGNPHVVVFVKNVKGMDLRYIGPSFEYNGRFPRRVNVEFVEVINRRNIRVRVWERGAGETLACGTGACAAVVAAVLNNLTEREVRVKLLGGVLDVEWRQSDNTVYMAGPAQTVFDGEIDEAIWV